MNGTTYLTIKGLMFTALSVSGCSIPVVGALTINHLVSATSALTTAMTGKGVGDIALDKMTGRDCRMIVGTFRSDREVCEISGSPATAHDFKGLSSVLAYLEKEVAPGEGGQSGTEIPFKIERTSGN